MLDLQSAFEDFVSDLEVKEPSIDRDFITAFLLPFFRDLPREELAAKLDEIIAGEQRRLTVHDPRRRTVANRSQTN